MDWSQRLSEGEQTLWQGRPAPRCYTFRNWKLALIGLILFLASSFWLMLGFQLAEDGYAWPVILIPMPLVVASLVMGPGQIILARMNWERTFYCLTEKKFLLQQGLLKKRIKEIPVGDITSWKQKRHGEQLASIRIQYQQGERFSVLHCLEQPQNLIDKLTQLTL